MSRQVDIRDVALWYDQGLGKLFQILCGDNLHVGYWPNADDDCSLIEGQESLTRLMIQKVDARSGQCLLDVGCGTGLPAIRLAQETGCEVVGVNVSLSQIELANDRARSSGLSKSVRFEFGNAMALPFPPESFDAAWAFETLPHMDRPQVFREIHRILRPGGRLVIADLYAPRLLSAHQIERYCSLFELNSLAQFDEYPKLLCDANFIVADVQDISTETERTTDKVLEVLVQKYGEIERRFGSQLTEVMKKYSADLRVLKTVKIGYVIVVAHKPVQSTGRSQAGDDWELLTL
jgi:cyclopropane fatty-acyl-phospholipid synthase-like methyltransferase